MSEMMLSNKGVFGRSHWCGTKLAALAASILLSAAVLAAPPGKSRLPTMVTESGSGSLYAAGSVDTKVVDFIYPEVRHVSLTIGWYSEEEGAAADLFAGPVWADGMRSKYVWDTIFSSIRSEDDFDYFETQTVEFDASQWKIELISLSLPEKYVRYHYTVTYPKP